MRSKLKKPLSHPGTNRSRKKWAYALGGDSFVFGFRVDKRIERLSALNALQKFAERHLEGGRKRGEMVKADFAHTPLKIRDEDLVDTGMLGEVDLAPTILLSEFPDSFAQFDANIRMHPSSIDLVEALYLVDALSVEKRRKSEGLRTACHPWPLSVTASEGAGVEEVASSYAKISMKSSVRAPIGRADCALLRRTR